MLQEILEARNDLKLYKKLLLVMGEYCDKVPATGLSRVFTDLLKHGIKALPKEEHASDILCHILHKNSSSSSKIQELLNIRFSDLPVEHRPVYIHDGRKHVAFWERDGKVYDRVMALINIDSSAQGRWADEKGEKVEIIDVKEEK